MDDAGESVIAYLSLGSNQGERAALLSEALERIVRTPGLTVTRRSSSYETEPVGLADQPCFLNAVAEIRTTLPPAELLATILQIEQRMGRTRTIRWGPRVIDIDILLYGQLAIAAPGLTIPHPRLAERAFALVPLVEIAPGARFPDGETAQKKLKTLRRIGNNLGVRIVQ